MEHRWYSRTRVTKCDLHALSLPLYELTVGSSHPRYSLILSTSWILMNEPGNDPLLSSTHRACSVGNTKKIENVLEIELLP